MIFVKKIFLSHFLKKLIGLSDEDKLLKTFRFVYSIYLALFAWVHVLEKTAHTSDTNTERKYKCKETHEWLTLTQIQMQT